MALNINDFKYIVDIADSGSITSTAKKFFITQSALSQRIKAIETEYGVHLFSRSSAGVSVSPDGELFVKYGKRILSNNAGLQEELQFRENKIENIKFGISRALNSSIFYDTIIAFCSRHPELQLSIFEQTSHVLQEWVTADKLDIAMGYMPVINNELSHAVVYTDKFVILPAYGGQLHTAIQENGFSPFSSIPASLLCNEPFAASKKNSWLRKYLFDISSEAGFSPNICHTTESMLLLSKLAQNGIASAVLYESFFCRDSVKSEFFCVDSPINNKLQIALFWRKESHFRYIANEIAVLAKTLPFTHFGTSAKSSDLTPISVDEMLGTASANLSEMK